MKQVTPFLLICILHSMLFAQKMTVKDDEANVLMEVNDEGNMGSITLPDTNAALSSEGNKLYSRNDTLIWNGQALSTESGGSGDFSNGGEAGGADRTLGNTDNYALGFKTNDATRLHITNDGKIGIGTTSPITTVDVGGMVGLFPKHLIFCAADGDGAIDWGNAGNGRLYFRTLSTRGSITPYTNRMTFLNNGNVCIGSGISPKNKLDIEGGAVIGASYSGTNTAPANGLLVEGNVGIGITSPDNELDVNGTVEMTGFKMPTSATNGYVLTSDASGVGTWQAVSGGGGDFSNGGEAGGADRTLGNTDNYALGFKTNDATRLHITNDGNIGIGTDDPEELLHLQSGITQKPVLILENTNDDAWPAELRFSKNSSTPGTMDIIGQLNWYSNNSSSTAKKFAGIMVWARDPSDGYEQSQMIFYTIDLGTLKPTLMLHRGRVGIGTSSPDPLATLDVNGTIYQRGSLLHADYVFEEDYDLESIEEHAAYMWKHKHLKAIPKVKVDEEGQEIVEVGSHRRGIVEELEKAHIYIEQLYKRVEEQQKSIQEQQTQIEMLRDEIKAMK